MLVLYNPKSTNPGKEPLPLSLLSLGRALEESHQYEIIDGNFLQDPIEDLPRILREKKASMLGMTVMPGPQLNEAVPLTRRIKQEFSQLPVVWGGYFPTQHADVVLKSGMVDYAVQGQGEFVLLELLDALKSGGDLSGIKGLRYRGERKADQYGSRNPLPVNGLERLPYHRLDMERYIRQNYIGSRTTDHNSSFGCPFACNFCAIVSMTNRRWLPESPESMADTLSYLREQYNVNGILFHDMDFFISESRVEEFCDRIKNFGMSWWALGRTDELYRFKESTWKLMQKSGLKMIFCGAETGSDEMLKRMNKGGMSSTQAAKDLVVRMKEYGIIPEYSFVLGNPPEPERDIDITFEFIRQLKALNSALEIILYCYTPVPLSAAGGELYELTQKAGFQFPRTLEEWVQPPWDQFAMRREPNTPWLDSRIFHRIRNFERVINAYYPTSTDINLTNFKRSLLKHLSGWRYHFRLYHFPIELRLLQRAFSYQRPETTGF